MSSSLDRHRISRKYRNDEHAMDLLEGAASDDAAKYAGLASMLAQAGGEIASSTLKAQEEKKKSEAQKVLVPKAKEAREKANTAANEARYARLAADASEPAPMGPQHIAAMKLADIAMTLDAKARELEVAAGMASPESLAMTGPLAASKPFVFPTWAKWTLGGLGGVVVLGIGWKLLSGGRR